MHNRLREFHDGLGEVVVRLCDRRLVVGEAWELFDNRAWAQGWWLLIIGRLRAVVDGSCALDGGG